MSHLPATRIIRPQPITPPVAPFTVLVFPGSFKANSLILALIMSAVMMPTKSHAPSSSSPANFQSGNTVNIQIPQNLLDFFRDVIQKSANDSRASTGASNITKDNLSQSAAQRTADVNYNCAGQAIWQDIKTNVQGLNNCLRRGY